MNNEWHAWRKTVTLTLQLGRNGQAMLLGKWSKAFEHQDGYFLEPIGDHCTNLERTNDTYFPRSQGKVKNWCINKPHPVLLCDKPVNLQYAKNSQNLAHNHLTRGSRDSKAPI